MKDLKEIRAMADKDLAKEIPQLKSEHAKQKYLNTQGNVKDTSTLKKMRKNIARMKTIQRQHEKTASKA